MAGPTGSSNREQPDRPVRRPQRPDQMPGHGAIPFRPSAVLRSIGVQPLLSHVEMRVTVSVTVHLSDSFSDSALSFGDSALNSMILNDNSFSDSALNSIIFSALSSKLIFSALSPKRLVTEMSNALSPKPRLTYGVQSNTVTETAPRNRPTETHHHSRRPVCETTLTPGPSHAKID